MIINEKEYTGENIGKIFDYAMLHLTQQRK